MTRRRTGGLFVGLLFVGLVAGLRLVPQVHPARAAHSPTDAYLAGLDVRRFERQGTDYTNPAYSPLRLGKPLAELDVVWDYDYPRLEVVARRLDGVDRRTVLAAVFDQVTRGCWTNTERHLAVLKFLHKAGNHTLLQPTWPDRTGVFDPLVLLELGEMRCGQVNRLAVDLFAAAGFGGRLVQAAGHVGAEVYYDSGWHYFDATFGGNGESVRNPDGTIPSVAELSETPERIDGLTVHWEPDYRNGFWATRGWPYPSWNYFSAWAYAETGGRPTVYVKTATPCQERESRHYGWEYGLSEDDAARKLWDLPQWTAPTSPFITRCEILRSDAGRAIELEWEAAGADGFVVTVGGMSRGWNFDMGGLPDRLAGLKSSTRGWRPEDYEARFTLPPADLGRVEVRESRARVVLPDGRPVYVTVMAYDAHGRAAGRRVFPMSEELLLDP
jgi:hypothetical protein